MATVNLSSYKPSAGQPVAAAPVSNAFTAIEAAVNGIDATQFAAGRIFDPTKLVEASSVQRIADSVLGAPAASLDFSGISANFLHLLICCYLRGDVAAAAAIAQMRFNADAGGNYDGQELKANTTTVTGTGTSVGSATYANVGNLPANTAPATVFSANLILVPAYANTVGVKSYLNLCTVRVSSGAANDVTVFLNGGIWASTAAINRVTILPSGGNLVAGSRVSIYGLG